MNVAYPIPVVAKKLVGQHYVILFCCVFVFPETEL